jgi:GH3 auxin-responsive promoter
VFSAPLGFHQFVVEFLEEPAELERFRDALDAELSRRNADYLAHRAPGVGLPLPSVIIARPGSFEAWMRERGKLGGQNKVPRMDNSGLLTRELISFLRGSDRVWIELEPGIASAGEAKTRSGNGARR